MDHFSQPASPMDDIVEKFLIEQLDRDIDKASKKNLSNCKMFSVHDECLKLKKLIEEKKSKTGASLKHTRREKLYYLLNVMTEWLQLLEKPHLVTPAAVTSTEELRGRLKQIEKDLKEPLKGESEGGGNQQWPKDDGAAAAQDIYRWSSHAVDITKIHGFKDKRMIMERLLLKEGSKAIGIVGVAGVGKTALCQVAFNDQEVQKHFLLRIWLCLSRQQKLHSDNDAVQFFVKRILSCLGFEDDVIQKVGRGGLAKLQVALQQQLKRGEYFIVLDDVWKIEEGEKVEEDDQKMGEAVKKLFCFLIQDPSQYGSRHGGTVIVTSRSGKLEETVRPKNLYRLKLLPLADEESCWEIFSDAVVKDEIEELKKLKCEIVGNCQGLPLMAKMLGQICHYQPKNPENTT